MTRRVQNVPRLFNSYDMPIVSALMTPFNACACASSAVSPVSYINQLNG